jgi:hypothetical protein
MLNHFIKWVMNDKIDDDTFSRLNVHVLFHTHSRHPVLPCQTLDEDLILTEKKIFFNLNLEP